MGGLRASIVLSSADESSMMVREYLVQVLGFESVESEGREVLLRGGLRAYVLKGSHLHARVEELASLRSELLVVASTHRSEHGVKALTVHSTGNWTSEAAYGGLPRRISATHAGATRIAFDALTEEARSDTRLEGWWVGLEVTHHGPYSPVPLIYVEFGGPEDARRDPAAAEAVAEACVKVVGSSSPSSRGSIGVGGGHYAPAFTRVMADRLYDVTHVLPKYCMPEGIDLLGEAAVSVLDGCRYLLLDWKGTPGQHRQAVAAIAEELELELVRL